jgi:hypothetical protein
MITERKWADMYNVLEPYFRLPPEDATRFLCFWSFETKQITTAAVMDLEDNEFWSKLCSEAKDYQFYRMKSGDEFFIFRSNACYPDEVNEELSCCLGRKDD